MSGDPTGFGLDHLPYGVFSVAGDARRVGVRFGDTVVDLATTGRPELAQPSLNPLMALGAEVWARDPRAGPVAGRERRRAVVPARRGGAAPAVRGRRLRRLLRLARARHQRRPDVPARPGAAAAQLAAPAGRLPRPRRHGRAERHADRAAARAAQGPDGGAADVRPEPEARHRGRARLRGRRPVAARRPGAGRGAGRARLRGGRAQRLVGARHPGVGVRAARARSSASPSRPRSPTGSPRSRRSTRPGSTCPGRTRAPLDYLDPDGARGLDLAVEVELDGVVVSRPPYASMYWGPSQMLAHLTANGASLRTGDLFASGTISGAEPDQRGSLLELSWGGQEPFGGELLDRAAPSSRTATRWCCATPRPAPTVGGSRSARCPGGSSPREADPRRAPDVP